MFHYQSTKFQKTTNPFQYIPIALQHESTGRTKSNIKAGASAASSTKAFVRGIPVRITDETEEADVKPRKRNVSDVTVFMILQLPNHPVLHVLTDRVAKIEEETDHTPNDDTKLKSEVGRLKVHRNTTNTIMET